MAVASAYPTYRPSGLPWIGKIPEHWEVRRISTLGRVGNGSTPSRSNLAYWSDAGLPWLNSGVVHQGVVKNPPRWVTQTAVRECHLPIVPKGSVVLAITGQGKTRGTPALLGIDAAISQHLAYISIRDHVISGAYLRFALTAGYGMLRAISDDTGGTKGALTCSAVKRFSVALPPRPEQDQIVAYLRVQDAHIARFIKAKRDLIKLLTEQKLRIIDHAVTRGLDPAVALKPSGIEWLGEVPEHWEVKPLKHWARLNARTLGEKTNPDFEFRYVDIGSVQTGRLAKELERIRFEVAPSRARRVLRRGDTIVSTVRTYLKAIWYVSEDADDLIASTGFAVLTPGKSVEPEYLGYVIQSSALVNRVAANSIGIAYPAIAETVLGRFPVALPPTVDEQQAIVAHIKTESAPLDETIARTEEEIKLIREYRDRLIADVVTGQVDVRGWQPGPDDVVDDAELAALGDDPDDVTEMEVDDGGE